jgi:hypothetical protein
MRQPSRLSDAPRIAHGGNPSQGIAAINPVMHQEPFDEGAHLISPRERRSCVHLPNDRSFFVPRQAEVSIASPLSTEKNWCLMSRRYQKAIGHKLRRSPLRIARPDHRRAVGVLDLDPVPRRPRPVGRGEPLRHDALKAHLASLQEDQGAVRSARCRAAASRPRNDLILSPRRRWRAAWVECRDRAPAR